MLSVSIRFPTGFHALDIERGGVVKRTLSARMGSLHTHTHTSLWRRNDRTRRRAPQDVHTARGFASRCCYTSLGAACDHDPNTMSNI